MSFSPLPCVGARLEVRGARDLRLCFHHKVIIIAPHPATIPPAELLAACNIVRTRRSGPGGQHRNKVETAVVLEHLPTGTLAEASERRSQVENQQVALNRLRVTLAVEVRTSLPPDSDPSPLWQSRCRNGKIIINPEHADFPALLSEALDVLSHHDMNLKPAAESLKCTSTQLTRFLKLEPRAFSQVNSRRKELGLHPLQ